MATNASAYPTANEMNHRFVRSNGIKMHIAEDGEGPLVVLCHGYPELWYDKSERLLDTGTVLQDALSHS